MSSGQLNAPTPTIVTPRIAASALAQRRANSQQRPGEGRNGKGEAGEKHRPADPAGDQLAHRPPGGDRAAEIAVREPGEIPLELCGERQIEAVVGREVRACGGRELHRRGGAPGQGDRERIAGKRARQQEVQNHEDPREHERAGDRAQASQGTRACCR